MKIINMKHKYLHAFILYFSAIGIIFSQVGSREDFLSFDIGDQYIYKGEACCYSDCSVLNFENAVEKEGHSYLRMHTRLEYMASKGMPLIVEEYDYYISQNGSKVYGYSEVGPIEMYDYSLNVGDTMHFDSVIMEHQEMHEEMFFVVDSTTTIVLESQPRKANYGQLFYKQMNSERRDSMAFATLEGLGFLHVQNQPLYDLTPLEQTLLGKFKLLNIEGYPNAVRFRFQNELVDFTHWDQVKGCELILDHNMIDSAPVINIAQNPVIGDRLILTGINETSKYIIYDSKGANISSGFVGNEGIDVSVLSSGIYILKIIEGSQLVSLKFVKLQN